MADAPDLTVVVLSWNTRDLTLAALGAVKAAAAPMRARVVCVDNGSADGTVAAVRERFPSVVVVAHEENLGFARGNDAALPHLAGRAVVFLNSDTEARPGSLSHVVGYLDEHPEVGIACPPLVGPDGAPQRAGWGVPTARALLHQYTPLGWLGFGRGETRRTRPPRGGVPTTGPVEAVSGACLVVRRDLFERLGGFDPGYPFYFEDVDLCWRARAAGAEVHVVADGPPVVHRGGESVALAGGATRLPLMLGLLRLQRKRLGPWAYGAFALTFKAGAFVRSLADALRAPGVAAVRRLRGQPERASRALRMGKERLRFLTRDLLAFLRA